MYLMPEVNSMKHHETLQSTGREIFVHQFPTYKNRHTNVLKPHGSCFQSSHHQLTMAYEALRYFSKKCNMLFTKKWFRAKFVARKAGDQAASHLENHVDHTVNEARLLWRNKVNWQKLAPQCKIKHHLGHLDQVTSNAF